MSEKYEPALIARFDALPDESARVPVMVSYQMPDVSHHTDRSARLAEFRRYMGRMRSFYTDRSIPHQVLPHIGAITAELTQGDFCRLATIDYVVQISATDETEFSADFSH